MQAPLPGTRTGHTRAHYGFRRARSPPLRGRHPQIDRQSADGTYAGHHPSDSAACIAELEWRRRRGADFLVIPSPSRWWLDHYREFAEHLNRKYLAVEDGPALIVALNRGEAETRSPQSLPST